MTHSSHPDPDVPEVAGRVRAALTETAERVPVPPVPSFSWERTELPVRGRSTRRRTARRVVWGLVPAAAAAAVVGTLLIVTGSLGDGPGRSVAPAAYLAPGGTTPMSAGQYFYSRVTISAQSERSVTLVETWQPQRASDVWTRRITQQNPDGTLVGRPRVTTAPCGRFDAGPGVTAVPGTASACDGPGSWAHPTPEFLATRPTDPGALYENLHSYVVRDYEKSAADRKLSFDIPNVAFLTINYVTAIGTNSSGLSRTFSAALQQAVARIPGVVVRQGVTNAAGVGGTGYEIHAPNGKVAGPVIFDAKGDFVGTPETAVVVGAADTAGTAPAGIGTD